MSKSKQKPLQLDRLHISNNCEWFSNVGKHTRYAPAQAAIDYLTEELVQANRALSWYRKQLAKLEKKLSKENK